MVHKAQDIAGFMFMDFREVEWIRLEAQAHIRMGNLFRALELSLRAEDLLASVGMQGSDRYLGIVDLRANVHPCQSECLEARELYAQMAKKTSPTCSPQYHAHALCSIAALDINRSLTKWLAILCTCLKFSPSVRTPFVFLC
jgi:hypothetical protein